MTNREQFIQGLRQFADWLAANPNMPTPHPQDFLAPLPTNRTVLDIAEHLNTEVSTDAEGNCRTRLSFGPVGYRAFSYADFQAHLDRSEAITAQLYAERHNLTLTPKNQETAA